MEQRTALWVVALMAIAMLVLVMGFSHSSAPTYAGIPMSQSNGVYIINTETGEVARACSGNHIRVICTTEIINRKPES